MTIQRHRRSYLEDVALVTTLSATALFSFAHVAHAGYGEGTYYAQSAYYGQSFYYGQSSYQTTFSYDTQIATLSVTGSIYKGSGTFVIDHPLDPKNKLLYHSFVESPDVKDWYDGTATLDANGEAIVRLPDYFEALNKDFRYQVKPIGSPMPKLYIKSGVDNNLFVIGGGASHGVVSWQVTGIREDAYILANPIIVEVMKSTSTPVQRGEYLHPGVQPQGFLETLTNTLQSFASRIAGTR